MRVCPVCHLSKALAEFSNPELPCKPCNRERSARWYAAHKELVKERIRQQEQRDMERTRTLYRAKLAVRRAVARGRLARPEHCEQCGSGGPIEAAHHDYSRRLDVRWLCRSCHRTWDRQQPKYAMASLRAAATTRSDGDF